MARKKIEVPQCLGYWDPCITCDGGYNPQPKEHEVPCSWLSRCRLFQEWILKSDEGKGVSPDTFIKRIGAKSTMEIIIQLEKGEEPSKRRKKKSSPKGTPAQRRKKRYQKVKEKLDRFLSLFISILEKRDHTWVERRARAVLEGQVYCKEQIEKYRCVDLYMRKKKGKDLKIATIKLAPNKGGLDLLLPVKDPPDDFPSNLNWVKWKMVYMLSAIKTLRADDDYVYAGKLICTIIEKEQESCQV